MEFIRHANQPPLIYCIPPRLRSTLLVVFCVFLPLCLSICSRHIWAFYHGLALLLSVLLFPLFCKFNFLACYVPNGNDCVHVCLWEWENVCERLCVNVTHHFQCRHALTWNRKQLFSERLSSNWLNSMWAEHLKKIPFGPHFAAIKQTAFNWVDLASLI